MSERFVESFLVSPQKLAGLVGTHLEFERMKKSAKNKHVFSETAETLGEGDEDEGRELVDAGLEQLSAGKPDPENAYELTRLTTLVLHAFAEPLKPSLMETNFLPADDFGLWNPAFRALKMPTIAKSWGQSSLAFPFKKRTKKTQVEWPIMTLVEAPELLRWKAELDTPWRAALKTLPPTALDPDQPDNADEIRDELKRGLAVLEKWVETALKPTKLRPAVDKTGNALVLVLDGDQ